MEELADLLREGEVFSVEPDEGGFTVGYDDVVAHEYADLVGASVDAIAEVAGVLEVVHEDRELLLVRTDGSTSARLVAGALDRFWRAAAKAPLPWKETLKSLAGEIAPTLRSAGFRKQGLKWNREVTPTFVQVVELSRAETNDGYEAFVEVGIYDEEVQQRRHPLPPDHRRPKFLGEIDCQIRHQAGSFPLTDDARPLVALVEHEVLPLLQRVTTRRAVLDEAWGRQTMTNPIDRAIGLALEGDTDAAHVLLQDRFDASRARAHILEVAGRCGLPPILTGSTPDRSRAEDAFLPRWIAGQAGSRARFRETFARTGGDARALDGSVRSLDALFPRWRGVVAVAQGDPTERPPTPLGEVPTGAWSRTSSWGFDRPVPSSTARQLAEDLASYLGEILERAHADATWVAIDTSSGFSPAIAGLPAETAHVMKKAIDFLVAATVPLTREQEQLYRRYNPMRAEVERWLEGAAPARRGLLERFRRR